MSELKIKVSPTIGKKYAEFWVWRSGKMKKSMPASISDVISSFMTLPAVHPLRETARKLGNSSQVGTKAKYGNVPIELDALRLTFMTTVEEQFAQSLDSSNISLEEKAIVNNLIENKPKLPYLFRDEFATEIAPKVPNGCSTS